MDLPNKVQTCLACIHTGNPNTIPTLNKETTHEVHAWLALLVMLFPGTLMAANDTQTIYLATPVRAGNAQLPRGICEVSWNAVSGSRVRLTIKTEHGKSFTVSARMVERKQDTTGVVTSVINGVTYLQELHTRNARFVIQNRTEGSK
jgi:hypothetical protein